MATQTHVIGSTAVDIVAALSLTNGAAYNIQVIDGHRVYIAEATIAPDWGHYYELGERFQLIVGVPPVWAWSAYPARIAVTEAA